MTGGWVKKLLDVVVAVVSVCGSKIANIGERRVAATGDWRRRKAAVAAAARDTADWRCGGYGGGAFDGAASSREACWRHCGGKFIFKPIIWAFRFDNSPLVCFSLPSTEGQWMFVRSSSCVLWYAFRDNCCSRGVRRRSRVSVVPPMTSIAAGRRPFAFRARHDRAVATTVAAAAAVAVNASR